jgi:predicted RND superfamily exporter protein
MKNGVVTIMKWIPLLFFLFLMGLSKNHLFLILPLSAILLIVTFLFQIKNWKEKWYCVAIFPICVAEAVVLVYVYLFRTVYLQSLILNVIFVSFILIVGMELGLCILNIFNSWRIGFKDNFS